MKDIFFFQTKNSSQIFFFGNVEIEFFNVKQFFFLIKKIKLENLSPSHSNIEIDLFLLSTELKNALPFFFLFFRIDETSRKIVQSSLREGL